MPFSVLPPQSYCHCKTPDLLPPGDALMAMAEIHQPAVVDSSASRYFVEIQFSEGHSILVQQKALSEVMEAIDSLLSPGPIRMELFPLVA